ncbi:MAG: hypothetical protein LC790_14230 [Actinobacteria bacterium]|nr:hypothetical protein [Actinomycetota bacterium]
MFATQRSLDSVCAQREAGFAATNPGDIEERLENPDLPPLEKTRLELALTACMPVWEQAFRQARQDRAGALVSEHSAVLEAARIRYADAMQTIQADPEFLEFLAVHG